MRSLYIEFERDRSIGLVSTFGDVHTDTHTHTHTHTHRHTDTHTHTHTHTKTFFLKLIFRLWE